MCGGMSAGATARLTDEPDYPNLPISHPLGVILDSSDYSAPIGTLGRTVTRAHPVVGPHDEASGKGAPVAETNTSVVGRVILTAFRS